MNKIRFSDRWIFAVHQTGGSGELGCNPSPNLQNNVDWTVKLPRCLQKSHKGEDQLYCSMACLKSALLVMDLRAEPPSHQPKTNCPHSKLSSTLIIGAIIQQSQFFKNGTFHTLSPPPTCLLFWEFSFKFKIELSKRFKNLVALHHTIFEHLRGN